MLNSTDSTLAEPVAAALDVATAALLDEVALSAAVDEALAVANAGTAPRSLTLAERVAVALDVHLGDHVDDATFTAAVDAVVDAVARHSARA